MKAGLHHSRNGVAATTAHADDLDARAGARFLVDGEPQLIEVASARVFVQIRHRSSYVDTVRCCRRSHVASYPSLLSLPRRRRRLPPGP
jgi:hypothetical protein